MSFYLGVNSQINSPLHEWGRGKELSSQVRCIFYVCIYSICGYFQSEAVSKRLLDERVLPEDIEGGNILKTLRLKYSIVHFQRLNQNIYWNHGKHEYKNNV